MKKIIVMGVLVVSLGAAGCSKAPAIDTEENTPNSSTSANSVLVPNTQANQQENNFVADTQSTERFVIMQTSMGNIKFELFTDNAPQTTANFLKLAKSGFYDGVAFHRVIKDFMIQGGDPLSKDSDPTNDGTGGPGYFIDDEFFNGSSNVKGTISMANAGPNTGGSQFFINLGDNTFLDYDKPPASSKHPVFGKVVEGMDVVEKIGIVETTGSPFDRPLEAVIINNILVE